MKLKFEELLYHKDVTKQLNDLNDSSGKILAKIVKYQKDHPDDKEYIQKHLTEYNELSQVSYSKALSISAKERKLYDALYREKQKNNTGPNPCKDFVL